jgi:hypothetical protein
VYRGLAALLTASLLAGASASAFTATQADAASGRLAGHTMRSSAGEPVIALASPKWWPRERLPATPATLSVGPDGVGLIFGFANSAGYTRVVGRPLGGPPGSRKVLPALIGYQAGIPLVVGWFPDGSSLIANPGTDSIAFRPPGALAKVGAAHNLGPGEGPTAITTGPSGVALIGLGGNLGAGVATRSAGARGSVDMPHAQYFGPGTVLGVALDSNGAAVVAWIDTTSGVLEQAVRNAGATSFGTPTAIVSGPYRVAIAVDSSGYAVISWAGGPPGPDSYPSQVFATERAPGGAFGAAQQIGDSPNGDPLTTIPAVTSNGDALVGWTRISSATLFAAEIATSHSGAWSPQKTVAAASSQIDGVASAGTGLLLATDTRGPTATVYDVLTGLSTTGGIILAAPKGVPAPPTAMGAGASGTALYVYGTVAGGVVHYSVLPYEKRG